MKKLATLSHIRINYQIGALRRADLIFTEGGYQLCVHTDGDELLVARRGGDLARNWTSVDRALVFVRRQFGFIREIKLIHPSEGETSCKKSPPAKKVLASKKSAP